MHFLNDKVKEYVLEVMSGKANLRKYERQNTVALTLLIIVNY